MSTDNTFPVEMTESVAIPVGDGVPFPSPSTTSVDPEATHVQTYSSVTALPTAELPTVSDPTSSDLVTPTVPERVQNTRSYDQDSYYLAIEAYNDKSFKVTGNSKPFRFTLRQMGGSWNMNLQNGAGWIFSLKHQDDVVSFVKRVNSGEVEPDKIQPRGNKTNYKKYKRTDTHVGQNHGNIDLPVTYVSGQKYGDNRMQQVVYTVFRPKVGMSAKIKEGYAQMNYPVTRVGSSHNNGIIDEAYITWNNGSAQIMTMLAIVNGHWKVYGKATEHKVTFM